MKLTTPEYIALLTRRPDLRPLDTAAARVKALQAGEAKSPVPAIKSPAKCKRGAKKATPSHLEVKFLRIWKDVGGPELESEYRFHPKRRWRADFYHAGSRTLIEIEGGAFHGRHVTGKGFLADAEKYLAAYQLQFAVVRLTAPQLTRDNILAVALRCAIWPTR